MNQLTVRGFDPALARRIREVAKARGLSLNQAAVLLIRQGAGLGARRTFPLRRRFDEGADRHLVARGGRGVPPRRAPVRGGRPGFLEMKVLLDTNAYSALKRGVDTVVRRVTRAETVFLSTVVAGELLAGFRQGTRLRKNLAELDAFIDNPHVTVVPVSLRHRGPFRTHCRGAPRQGAPDSHERYLDRGARHGDRRRPAVVRCAFRRGRWARLG